jgi:hypothetical protein
MSAMTARLQISDTLPFERTVRVFDAYGAPFDLSPYEVCFVGRARADSTNAPLFNYSSIRDTSVLVDPHSSTVRVSIPRAMLDKLKNPHYAISLKERATGAQLRLLSGNLQKAPSPDDAQEFELFLDGELVSTEALKRLDPELFRGHPGQKGERATSVTRATRATPV